MTRETIIEYMKQHPEIKTRTELQKSYYSMYEHARKFNMLDELFGLAPNAFKWTEDGIKQYVLEHPEINSRTLLKKLNYSAYYAAKKL